MKAVIRSLPVWAICWMIAVLAALICRPPLPVDETRYLSVAWEMWLRGDFLVPHLNGEPYHHKPPLLFWLMNAGWSVFGVNDWWPRLVAPLFALASLWGTAHLARELWPDDDWTPSLAPLVLVGAAFWSVFQTLTMFDMMLAGCTIAALIGVVRAWRTGGLKPWIAVGVAIGAGVLAKGPAILLHVLPVAVLAPWWGIKLPGGPGRPLTSWPAWYGRILLSVLIGAAIALVWAVPAGIRGGEEYREMIFWGQSAGRIVESFDHARPFWWYAALLPPLLLPWLVWPRLWRAFKRGVDARDGAMRLLFAWAFPALAIFSLISGKQLHYLLPEFAAFALFFARALAAEADRPGWRLDGIAVAVFFVILGIALLLLPNDPTFFEAPAWFHRIDTGWGVLLILAGAACWVWTHRSAWSGTVTLAAAMATLVATVHLGAKDSLSFAYDLRPIAGALKTYEEDGRPLANFGYYHGQYQFLGRLETPMKMLGLERKETRAWVNSHPDGIVVAYYYVDERPEFPDDAVPLATYRFRDFDVVFWPVPLLERYPNLANRS